METPTKQGQIRYRRQIAYVELASDGQRLLQAARALIVGLGGLGSWTAELLARAGVGFLRLLDDDKVDLTNLHRQAMYDETDASVGAPKAQAAAAHIKRINSAVAVEPVVARLDADNVASLADAVDVILDGTDNFATRFIINDYAVKTRCPWVFAGVLGAEAQTMTIVPHRTACLRCVYDSPPPPCIEPTCRSAGVLGPAVATIAAIQTAEAMKILSGRSEKVSPYLLKLDLWANSFQRIDAASARSDCPCCKQGHYDFLNP